jgi:hypothetical protein
VKTRITCLVSATSIDQVSKTLDGEILHNDGKTMGVFGTFTAIEKRLSLQRFVFSALRSGK